jgi:hypothetical protein
VLPEVRLAAKAVAQAQSLLVQKLKVLPPGKLANAVGGPSVRNALNNNVSHLEGRLNNRRVNRVGPFRAEPPRQLMVNAMKKERAQHAQFKTELGRRNKRVDLFSLALFQSELASLLPAKDLAPKFLGFLSACFLRASRL